MGKTNNPNGRPKGKPNKITGELKQWVSNLIDKNRDQFEIDLLSVEPEKRLAIIEKLMSFVIPKMQSISMEAQIQSEYQALEKLLDNAPEEAIQAITERILMLKQQSDE